MNKTRACIAVLLVLVSQHVVQAQELRGTWLARTSFTSKAKLASQMDSLAAANFNVVYVNVWSRGYPLWQSEVFKQHTGVSIDPAYANRDILAEAIAEGHRVGLHVEAWFEYGFVGGYNPAGAGSKGPVFDAHPAWVAQTQSGVEKDGSNFYWMVHSHPEVQKFLIDLATEVVNNYDVDGVEMDRIRYSSKEYGYDPFTVDLYKREHNGAAPPSDVAEPAWMQWRAQKLNVFVATLYDALKAANPQVNVSSAPSQMGASTYTAYENLLQDWKWWISNRKVDNLQMQSYTSSLTAFQSWNTYTKRSVANYEQIYPSFAASPGSTKLTGAQLVDYINSTNELGFKGAAIWFYDDLVGTFKYLKQTRYAAPSHPPYASADWRAHKAVALHTDTDNVIKTGAWAPSSIEGYNGRSVYGGASGNLSIEYFLNVPAEAFYEVYVFNTPANNRTASAEFQVFDSKGTVTVKTVNQTNALMAGWVKLGDFYLTAGRKRVVKLTNTNLAADQYLSADAVMIVRNRKLDHETAPPLGVKEGGIVEREVLVMPHPITGSFTVRLPNRSPHKLLSLTLVNTTGKAVYKKYFSEGAAANSIAISDLKAAAGVYLMLVETEAGYKKVKVVVH
ncbi:family 10 glycosylhydrolase [Rufibacter ruber]|uniref:family 10 glycosylhydrolase n=1 Tax=Rufibacter ruber TaxID=1783499 RepID=UPI00137ABFFB|nr:family 10 glycosylhydrolase [Rufibacter ruber]